MEEWRARAGRAEDRVRELEGTLGAYQAEVRRCAMEICIYVSRDGCTYITPTQLPPPKTGPGPPAAARHRQIQAPHHQVTPPADTDAFRHCSTTRPTYSLNIFFKNVFNGSTTEGASASVSAVWKERMELAQRELAAERTALAARCVGYVV